MQELSIAFGRVSRATFSTNPELKSQITDMVNRAYFNLHNMPLASADAQWAGTITASAMQICIDPRTNALTPRELIALFENIIRISEEHVREARRNAAMAANVFYLKETALDALITDQHVGGDYNKAEPTVRAGLSVAGRVRSTPPAENVA